MHPNIKDFLKNKEEADWTEFIDHLLGKIDYNIKNNWRILLLTLTKKSSEEITNFLVSKWYKAYYLHSEISTIERWEIITKLKTWEIDIIVGINLLREGIDIPQVSLIAILDADKEGFLRSTTSLIQIIWRAARNPDSEVILYWDNFTESIIKSLRETYRRREIQIKYNRENNIIPSKASSNVKELTSVKSSEDLEEQKFVWINRWKTKKLKRATKKEKEIIMRNLKEQLDLCIKEWKFEDAAIIRDQIKELEES